MRTIDRRGLFGQYTKPIELFFCVTVFLSITAVVGTVFGQESGDQPKSYDWIGSKTAEAPNSSALHEPPTPETAAASTPSKPIPVQSESTGVASSQAEAPYDPIKENGLFFEGWEKPKVLLLFTGLLNGYIEPCGCAGMDRMKGGLSRRQSFLEELSQKQWPVVPIDAGQIADGFGVQEESKFDMVNNAFRLMDYQAVGMGPNELRFPASFLLTVTVPASLGESSRFVSANVGVYGFDDLYTLPFKVVEKGGVKIGVTSVVFVEDKSRYDENIFIEPPEKKLREVLPRLLEKKCDHLVLIVHGNEKQTEKMAAAFPQFDIIVTGDSPPEPPAEPKTLGKNRYLVEVGEKGKFAIGLGFYDDASRPVRYQRVALDSRYAQSEDVHLLMIGYQEILKKNILANGYKGLGLGEIESPQHGALGDFVGSAKCESCHEESYRIWRKNRHSTAWNSLSAVPPTEHSANPPRDFDPECISCHVIGWQTQECFPYVGGFQTFEKTPHLANVGCESCHGPGSKHIEAELGDNESIQENLRVAMRLGENAERVCHSCHDGDNSPNFNFESYYKIIEHFDYPPDDEDNAKE